MDRCASFDAYRMSDALWNQFKKLLPKYKVSPLVEAASRPAIDRRCYLLSTENWLPVEGYSTIAGSW